VQVLRVEKSERHEDETDHAETYGAVDQGHHAGDDRGRRQHDADLIGSGCKLVVMVARQVDVALVLVCFGERSQLLATVLLRRIGLVARHRLHPIVDLLEQRRLPCFIGHRRGFER